VKRLAAFVLRRAGWISVFATTLGALGAFYCALLYKNLHTDLQELLPSDARSVVDLGEITKRLQSYDSLAVLVFTSDSKAGQRFVADFAREAEKLPSSLVASVDYRIDRELEFFQRRQALYLDLADLRRVPDEDGPYAVLARGQDRAGHHLVRRVVPAHRVHDDALALGAGVHAAARTGGSTLHARNVP